VLAEVVPLDAERRTESEVWLAFAGQALVDPTLRALREEIDDALYGLMRRLVEALVAAGEAAPDLDLDLEAERLNAVVDGLVVHALMRPDRVDPALMRAVVSRHLDGLRPS
jgi:hypothetical protein